MKNCEKFLAVLKPDVVFFLMEIRICRENCVKVRAAEEENVL